MHKPHPSTMEKAMMVRILLNQGVYHVHRYKYSKAHLVELANKLKHLGCVSITREGSKILEIKRKIKPNQMIEKMVKGDHTRKIYLATLLTKAKTEKVKTEKVKSEKVKPEKVKSEKVESV